MAELERIIKGLEDIQKHLDSGYSFAISWKSGLIRDALTLLKEQETIRQCKDCKFYAGTHPEFAMCSELDICVDSDFYCKYWRTEV